MRGKSEVNNVTTLFFESKPLLKYLTNAKAIDLIRSIRILEEIEVLLLQETKERHSFDWEIAISCLTVIERLFFKNHTETVSLQLFRGKDTNKMHPYFSNSQNCIKLNTRPSINSSTKQLSKWFRLRTQLFLSTSWYPTESLTHSCNRVLPSRLSKKRLSLPWKISTKDLKSRAREGV